jgi:hypothetical protein
MKVPPYLFVRRLFYPWRLRSDFRASFLRNKGSSLTIRKQCIFWKGMPPDDAVSFRICVKSGQRKIDRPDSAHGLRPFLNTSGSERRCREIAPPAAKGNVPIIRVSSSASISVRAHGGTLHGALAFGDAAQAARSNPAGPSPETIGGPVQEKSAAARRPGGTRSALAAFIKRPQSEPSNRRRSIFKAHDSARQEKYKPFCV